MFHAVRFLLVLLVVASSLMTCKRNADEEITPETELKILELHLAGISDKNISIDQEKRLITIQMPSTLSSINLKAAYKLGRNTKLVFGLTDGFFDARLLNKCFDAPRIGLAKADAQTDASAVEYSVVAVATGKLRATSKTLIEQEQNDVMVLSIPVENLYGNETVTDARVTREGSSEKISLLQEPSPYSCVWFTNGSNANQIDILTSRQLQPGRYTLELIQANGTVVPVQQPLIIKKGKAVLGYNEWIWGSMSNELLRVVGYNLFEGDISMTIVSKDKVHPLVLSNFSANGTGFTAATPALTPGNYIVKTYQNSQEIACQKMSVLREKGQPVLYSIFDALQPCSTYENLPLLRTKKYNVFYSPSTAYPGGKEAEPARDEQLQLSRTTNPAEKYTIPISPYMKNGNPEASAYFILPASVPAGSYYIKLQVKDPKTGLLSFSELYERIIEVQ